MIKEKENPLKKENKGFNQWMKTSNTFRIISIGILILILLIPTSMVKNLILERKRSHSKIIKEISSKWGNEQTITSLVLSIPYKKYFKNRNNELVENIVYAHFLPKELKINGEIFTEIRYRSIYEVLLYNSKLKIEGKFLNPSFKDWSEITEGNILLKDAFISLGISDMRGIKDNLFLNWNGKQYDFNSGLENDDVISSGVMVKIPLEMPENSKFHKFSLDLNINGSEKLFFVPVGKSTEININSKWKTPSFDGQFLPDTRDISENGFSATWKISHLNRNYPQKWLETKHKIDYSSFGLKLLIPANQYQKSMRSIKYAVLFIALTFLSFFFIEVTNKKKIHPIQYILVGLALVIFFVLLVSISEHLNFDIAFILSCIAVTTLITLYTKAIFKDKKLAGIIASILIIIYGFIYTILQLEDFALLIGSLGLFIVLTFAMYFSRKIDWYGKNKN